MPLITVKPKFRITIPAKLRKGLDLHEGDLPEATVVGDGILFRPREEVDRNTAADRIASILARVGPFARGRRSFRGRSHGGCHCRHRQARSERHARET